MVSNVQRSYILDRTGRILGSRLWPQPWICTFRSLSMIRHRICILLARMMLLFRLFRSYSLATIFRHRSSIRICCRLSTIRHRTCILAMGMCLLAGCILRKLGTTLRTCSQTTSRTSTGIPRLFRMAAPTNRLMSTRILHWLHHSWGIRYIQRHLRGQHTRWRSL